jgi:hypothetical protein
MKKIKHEDIILRGIIVAACTMLVATSVFPVVASLSIHKDMITTTQTAENNFIDTQPTASMNLEYSFLFRPPLLQRVDMQKNMFTTMEMPGSYIIGTTPGTPVFLVKPTKILLPQGTEVTHVDVTADKTMEVDTKASDIDLMEKPIVPYQLPVPISEHPSNFVINHEAYASINHIPDQIFENLEVGYCRGYAILTVNLYPTQYIPGEGRLFYHPEMTIKITLKENGPVNQFYRNDPSDRAWVETLVSNPEVLVTYGNDPTLGGRSYPGGLCDPSDNGGLGYDYVIITRSALFDFTGTTYNWTSLLNKKRSEGLQATKVRVESIISCPAYWRTDPLFNDTPAKIREFCKDAYQDWGTNYILIGGDADGTNMVQRRLLYYEYEGTVESDIYWTHLDNTFNADHDSQWGESGDAGFDLYSEMYSGSIPCDTGLDVSNWLTKTFFYADNLDKNYLDNAAFYGGALGWLAEGDDFIDYSAIKGTNDWLGPYPHYDGPFPSWIGFQYGFETWNQKNPVSAYNLSVKWTAESPNPGWQGGSDSAAITGLKNAINSDKCTLISAVAHADPSMSMDVFDYEWEANYHNTKPFFLTDYGCHCGDMDAEDDGVLHSMLFHSNTELAFACIYNTGYGWGNYYSTNSSSALQQKSFWDYLFDTTNNSGSTINWQMGKAQEWARDFMAPTINWDPGYETWKGTIECCLLFGDPAQVIKPPLVPQHNVGVQSLDVPDHVIPDQQIYVNATIVNNGRNDEQNVLVSFRVNGTQLSSTTIPYFANHTTQQVSFLWTPALGWYTVTMNVTIPGVSEEYYADNERSQLVIAGPDVAVTSLEVNANVAVGILTPVKGLVENLGATSETITVSLIINDTVEASQVISLASGGSQLVTFQWNPTDVGTYAVGIKASVSGVEPYTANNQMSTLVTVFIAQGYVLLVDDDTGDAYETYYESALTASHYLYTYWDRQSQGCPSVSTMSSYSAVVWFTGDDYTSTLDSTDKTNLAAYLNSGGGLFITGQDIGYDIGSDPFYANYLHATYQVDNTDIMTLNGVAGDPIGNGLTISISGGDGANNQDYPSGIYPITPATSVFKYQSSPYTAGLRVNTSGYKVVYFAFGFEGISTMNDRAEVMQRVLAWIAGTYTTPDIWINPTQFDVTAAPGEILNKTLTIGNDANATKELSFTIEIPHGWILQWEHQYGGDGHSQFAQPVGDIDGDGVNEVIVGGYASYSAIILSYNNNTGTYDQEYEWSEGSGTPSGACIVNLDGSGGLELVVSWVYGYADGIYAYHWDGSTLTTLSVYSGIGFNFAYDVYACDYDDDSHVEVLIANSPYSSTDYQVTALGWNTGGGFVREISWRSGSVTECPMVWSGDTDHDGKTEVIAAAGTNKVYALNYALGAWTATTVASGLPAHPYGIAVGDLDGNLGDEIGIGLYGTQAYIYKWNGSSSSYQQVWYHDYVGEQDIIEATAIGDADNDGQNEFLIGTNDIHVISYNGVSYNEESTILYTDGQLAGTIIGDCDTDGLNEVKANDILSGIGKEWIIEYLPEPTWLSVSPDHGTVGIGESMDITITVDATGLDPGTYASSLLIYSNDLDENSLEVPVNLRVLSGPILSYSPASHDFGNKHEGVTDSTTFEIWNSGSDTLDYTLNESATWVTVNPTSGSSTGEHDTIAVSIDTTGLSPGPHSCIISINSNGGDGTFTVTVNVIENHPPNKPIKPSGTTIGTPKTEYSYTSRTTDPDGDQIFYMWDWGDGNTSGWLGPYVSGTTVEASYTWTKPGTYDIKVKAKDNYNGAESEWSDTLPITIVICGDVNDDGTLNAADVVYLIDYLFIGGPEPKPMECVGDVNGDGIVDISDVVYLINYLFIGGLAPGGCCEN